MLINLTYLPPTSDAGLLTLKPNKINFELLSNPFAVDVENAEANLQMELIELRCTDTMKEEYERVGADEFAGFIPDTMTELCIHAAQTLSMFGSTYPCEQLLSFMEFNNTSHRSHLTNEHLHSILRFSSAQSPTPNIDVLVQDETPPSIRFSLSSVTF